MKRLDICSVPFKPAWTTTSAVTLAQPLMGVSDKGTADGAAAAAATEERACNATAEEDVAGLVGAEEPAACVTARPALNWRKTVPDVSTSIKKKALAALLPRLRPNSIYVKKHMSFQILILMEALTLTLGIIWTTIVPLKSTEGLDTESWNTASA